MDLKLEPQAQIHSNVSHFYCTKQHKSQHKYVLKFCFIIRTGGRINVYFYLNDQKSPWIRHLLHAQQPERKFDI